MINFIVASRADARGENTIDCVLKQMQNLTAAHVWYHYYVVEWGSPRDGRKPLHERVCDLGALGVVFVPDAVADLYSSPVVFNEFTAKNVGVRAALRSTADDDLVICTNSDLLFPPLLCEALAGIPHESMVLYRAPRWDHDGFDADGEPAWLVGGKHAIGEACGEAAGDFTGMSASCWSKQKGYWQSPNHRWHLDSELTLRTYRGVPPFRVVQLPPCWHQKHEGSGDGGGWRPAHGLEDDAFRANYGLKPGGGENWGLGNHRWEQRPYGFEVMP